MDKLPLCECGCGKQVSKSTNRFILGHHSRVMDCTWNRGLTKETSEKVKKQADTLKGRTKETHDGVKHQSEKMKGRIPWIKGKKHTEESRNKMSKSIKELNLIPWNKGKSKIDSNRLQIMSEKLSGEKHPGYKGFESGKYSNYDLYYEHISFCESVRRNKDNVYILEVRCSYCGKWFKPTTMEVVNRKGGIDNDTNKFYCSEECKGLCPIYMKHKYPNGFYKENTNVEVVPEVRKVVFKRDKYECQKCGNDEKLECHHIDPVSQEPFFANDPDSCINPMQRMS